MADIHSKSFSWKLAAAAIGTTTTTTNIDHHHHHHDIDESPSSSSSSPHTNSHLLSSSASSNSPWRSFPVNIDKADKEVLMSLQTTTTTLPPPSSPPLGLHNLKDMNNNSELNAQTIQVPISKGNLIDELQTKANELEKLFAQHKLRVASGDNQLTSSRRNNKPPTDLNPLSPTSTPQIDINFSTNNTSSVTDNGDTNFKLDIKQDLRGSTEESKGEFYHLYMKKRDAKLKKESSSKRAQKEAKMQAIHESLERSRAEMETNLSVSTQDSARRFAERLRSFNIRSTPTEDIDQPMDSLQNEISVDVQVDQSRFFSETYKGGAKKVVSNRSSSSSIPQDSPTAVTRSSIKPSNSASGKKRTAQPENLLARPVSSLSDVRKETTKVSSSGISKTTSHRRVRNYSRSKSFGEELSLLKEDNTQYSQSLRNSYASSGELRDLSQIDSQGVIYTPPRITREKTGNKLYHKTLKNVETKPFLRKGTGFGPGAGTRISQLKPFTTSENLKIEEDMDESPQMLEDPRDVFKMDEDAKFDPMIEEEAIQAVNMPADSGNAKSRPSQESEKSGYRLSGNSETLRSISEVDCESIGNEVSALTYPFNDTVEPVRNSLGENTKSSDQYIRQTFSSDVDASFDSLMASPISRNSHSLTTMEADAAWVMRNLSHEQNPILVANGSHNQPRKDAKRGFKRFLKFGRKTRGGESVVDWISATTSEVHEEYSTGTRNRASEEIQKSPMVLSHGYNSFNNGMFYNDQVQVLHSPIPTPTRNYKLSEDQASRKSSKAPKSFFSFSSFRSKGK